MNAEQKRFMEQNHPGMAHRWMAHGNAESESNETPKKGVKALPRKPEVKRDFGALTPSANARHKYSKGTSETTSMEEDGVEGTPEGSKGKMSLKTTNVLDPYAKRDAKLATRKRI